MTPFQAIIFYEINQFNGRISGRNRAQMIACYNNLKKAEADLRSIPMVVHPELYNAANFWLEKERKDFIASCVLCEISQ